MQSRPESFSPDVPAEVFIPSSRERASDGDDAIAISTGLAVANFVGIVALIFILLAFSGCSDGYETISGVKSNTRPGALEIELDLSMSMDILNPTISAYR